MAQARCDEHQPEPSGRDYARYALPVGYPDTAVTCDIVGCERPARLWLTAGETAAFRSGTLAFTNSRGASVQVSGDLFPD